MQDQVFDQLSGLIARSYELEQRVQRLQQTIESMRGEVEERVLARQRELDRIHAEAPPQRQPSESSVAPV